MRKRRRGIEAHDVEHSGVVRVRDAEPVRDHADDDQLRGDAGAVAVLAQRLGGVDLSRPTRVVVITALTLDAWSEPDAHIRVRCSKGTYIRVLAEDLGEALGCGAHLAGLRRTATGGFDIAEAHTLDRLAALDDAERDALLLPTDALLSGLPELQLTASEELPFRQGQQIGRHGVVDGAYRAYAGGSFLGVATAIDGSVRAKRLVAAHPSARLCDSLES